MDLLDLNLTFTMRTTPELIKNIQNINDNCEEFSILNAENGVPILAKNGILMNDKENPLQEIINNFRDLSMDKNNIYIIVGLELGHSLNFFFDNCPGKIIVFEPSLKNIKFTFSKVNLINHLQSANVALATNKDEFNKILKNYLFTRTGIYVFTNDYYKKEYAEYIEEFNQLIGALTLPKYKKGESLKLNIGPGRWVHENWRTLDYYRDADFFVDLRNLDKLEIEDNCIEKAFSSHCFEHIEDEPIQKLFNELYRTMKPGGILRFSSPDADKAIDAYKNNDISWFNWLKQAPIHEMLLNTFVSYESMSGGPSASAETVREKFNTLKKDEFIKWCVSLKDVTRPYIAHTNGIHFDKMKSMLEKAGFCNITKSAYMQSDDEEFRNSKFDKYENISLFVECRK